MALVLLSLILASATGSLLRQQRATSGLVVAGHGAAQARAATALLSAQLTPLAWSSADLGPAGDTVLQMRAPIAAGLACETAGVIDLADDDAGLSSAGVASAPRAGDSVWWYLSDSARWTGRPIAEAWTDSLRCNGAERGGDAPVARRVLRLRLDALDTVLALSPVRVTRQVRLTLYRSGDGTWQFGVREWSDVTHGWASPQPAAGPFQRIAADGARTGFRYFDAAGAPIDPDTDPSMGPRIARIRITAIALPAAAPMPRFGPPPRDSIDVAVSPEPAP